MRRGRIIQYLDSSLEVEDGPFAGNLIRARGALCPDGVRRTAYPTTDGLADTFFSIPARVRITRDGSRFTVGGYITIATEDGFTVESMRDRHTVLFRPYLYGANGHLLADDISLAKYVRDVETNNNQPFSAYGRSVEEMKRRGLTLVPMDHAPRGLAIFRTSGAGAGTLLRTESGRLV